MKLKITIIFLLVLAWFASYNIWILEKEEYIEEKNIIYEPVSEYKAGGVWHPMEVVYETDYN
jgi:hypothetical protein|tara:strand:+ start:429 stop:614 length:186 start_codon:yes stop_codon:yes gene_type:complete